jgi:hypothetical protein
MTLDMLNPQTNQKFRQSVVMENIKCQVGAAASLCQTQQPKRRFFRFEKIYYSSAGFSEISENAGFSSTMLVPMDVDEDGKMDLLVQYKDPNTNEQTIGFMLNNMNYDAFFIKMQMKFPEQVETFPSPGNILVGPTFRFIMTSLEDDQQYVRVGTQQH